MCGPFISTSVDHSLGNRGHSGKDLLVLGLGEALSVWRGKVGGRRGLRKSDGRNVRQDRNRRVSVRAFIGGSTVCSP